MLAPKELGRGSQVKTLTSEERLPITLVLTLLRGQTKLALEVLGGNGKLEARSNCHFQVPESRNSPRSRGVVASDN